MHASEKVEVQQGRFSIHLPRNKDEPKAKMANDTLDTRIEAELAEIIAKEMGDAIDREFIVMAQRLAIELKNMRFRFSKLRVRLRFQ